MRPAEPLAPAFATLGWFSGLWASEMCTGIHLAIAACSPGSEIQWLVPQVHLGWGERLAAGAILALAMWIAGAYCARHLTRGGGLFAVTAISISTCAVTAMAVGMFTLGGGTGEPGSMMALGIAAGVTTAPSCALAAHLSLQAWCARPKTVGHRLYRHSMWLAVAGYVVLVSARFAQIGFDRRGLAALDITRWGELSVWQQRNSLGACLLVAGTAAGVLLGALSIAHLVHLGRLRTLLRAKPKRGPQGQAQHFDLGVGDEEQQCVAHGTNPYRDTDHLVASCRGDFRRVGRTLGLATAAASALVVIAAVAVAFRDATVICY